MLLNFNMKDYFAINSLNDLDFESLIYSTDTCQYLIINCSIVYVCLNYHYFQMFYYNGYIYIITIIDFHQNQLSRKLLSFLVDFYWPCFISSIINCKIGSNCKLVEVNSLGRFKKLGQFKEY